MPFGRALRGCGGGYGDPGPCRAGDIGIRGVSCGPHHRRLTETWPQTRQRRNRISALAMLTHRQVAGHPEADHAVFPDNPGQSGSGSAVRSRLRRQLPPVFRARGAVNARRRAGLGSCHSLRIADFPRRRRETAPRRRVQSTDCGDRQFTHVVTAAAEGRCLAQRRRGVARQLCHASAGNRG